MNWKIGDFLPYLTVTKLQTYGVYGPSYVSGGNGTNG